MLAGTERKLGVTEYNELNVVFLQNLNVEALIPNGMVFEGGTSEN